MDHMEDIKLVKSKSSQNKSEHGEMRVSKKNGQCPADILCEYDEI